MIRIGDYVWLNSHLRQPDQYYLGKLDKTVGGYIYVYSLVNSERFFGSAVFLQKEKKWVHALGGSELLPTTDQQVFEAQLLAVNGEALKRDKVTILGELEDDRLAKIGIPLLPEEDLGEADQEDIRPVPESRRVLQPSRACDRLWKAASRRA